MIDFIIILGMILTFGILGYWLGYMLMYNELEDDAPAGLALVGILLTMIYWGIITTLLEYIPQ